MYSVYVVLDILKENLCNFYFVCIAIRDRDIKWGLKPQLSTLVCVNYTVYIHQCVIEEFAILHSNWFKNLESNQKQRVIQT